MARKKLSPIGNASSADSADVHAMQAAIAKKAKADISPIDILTKKMNSLSEAIKKANALGDHNPANKMAVQFNKLNERLKLAGGQSMPKMNASTAEFSGAASQAAASTGSLGLAVKAATIVYGTLTAAMIAATYAAYEFGSQRAVLEAQFTAMSRGGAAGRDVAAMLDRLSGSAIPNTVTEMAPWVKAMQKAGVTDLPRLEEGVKAAAAAMAVLGDEGARSVTGLVADLSKMARLGGPGGMGGLGQKAEELGLKLTDVTAKLGIKANTERAAMYWLNAYGAASKTNAFKVGNAIQEMVIKNGIPSMEAMNATWDVTVKKFKQNASALFNSIEKTEGFKAFALGLQRVAAFLGGTSKVAKGANSGLVSFFDSVFSMGAKLIEWAQLATLEMAILGLEIGVALLPVINIVLKVKWAFDDFTKGLQGGSEIAVRSVKGLAVILGVVAAVCLAASAPFIVLFGAIGLVVFGVTQFLGLVADAIPAVFKLAVGIGESVWKGIVSGVKSGIKFVTGIITEVGGSALGILKKVFDSHSPSREFAKIGFTVPQGVAGGVDRGQKLVHDSVSEMGKTAVDTGRGSMRGGGGGTSVSVQPGAIVVQASPTARETAAIVEENFVSFVERLALTQGAK